jgi:hypothetical protein
MQGLLKIIDTIIKTEKEKYYSKSNQLAKGMNLNLNE